MPEKKRAQKAPDKLPFELALAETEQIAEKIESGEINLEDSLAAYERGLALIKRCRQLLDQAEQRVQKLHLDEENEDTNENKTQ